MNRVIVTGANGFVGSNMVQYLLSQGTVVYAVVRKNTSMNKKWGHDKNLHIIETDMHSIHTLLSHIKVRGFDAFYHFAWQGSSGPERTDKTVQLNNISWSCNALQVTEKLECKKFLFSGSIMEYEAMKLLAKDSISAGLNNIYSTAKLTANFFLKTYACHLHIDYIHFIISNIYGPGEKSARLVNTTIRKMLNHEKTEFSPAEQLYDFIYVTDAVKQMYLVGQDGQGNSSYYIGSRRQKPLKDFLISIGEVCLGRKDIDIGIGMAPEANAILDFNEFDTQMVFQEFGYENETTFHEGIEKTIDFIKKEQHNDAI